MKKYILFFLMVFRYGFSNEIDSLIISNPFVKTASTFDEINEKHNFLAEDCDACGCSANGGSMGFASMINSNFVGIRYFNQYYKSTDGLYSNSEWYKESFNTIQIWSRIPISKKIQVNALIPFQFHNRESESGKQRISGLGDATIMGMHKILQTQKDSTKLFYHTLYSGSGVKIPLGKFDENSNGSFNPSYQVGTGSWDFLFASEYIVRYKKVGLNTMINYILKTENSKDYQFGNQINFAGTFFYLLDNKKISWAPQLGLSGEIYDNNLQMGQRVRNTDGYIFFGKAGFELGKKDFSIGTNFILPIVQNLNGGNLESEYRWSVNINYKL